MTGALVRLVRVSSSPDVVGHLEEFNAGGVVVYDHDQVGRPRVFIPYHDVRYVLEILEKK